MHCRSMSYGAQAIVGAELKYNAEKAYGIWAHNQ